jgi:tRNA-dihydrouridine synthase B
LIKPLTLGANTFPVNLIQGPLAGYTHAVFRALTWRYSKPAFSCSAMISIKALARKPTISQEYYLAKAPDEGPVCFQLFGDDPKELANATKIVADLGADLIDLNCGCPARKVRKQNSGSKLLVDQKKLAQLINAMRENTKVPISIKIRVEGKSNDKFNQDIAEVVNNSGLDFLVVHGRHWNEGYDTPCDYQQIRFFVEKVKIPVIGNGDITDFSSLQKMFATGCAGAMIGRAGVGQPWLIGNLIAKAKEEKLFIPSPKEIGLIFVEHIERLKDLVANERFAVLHARKIASHYARGLENRKVFCGAINSCTTFKDFKKICAEYFNVGRTATVPEHAEERPCTI